MSGEMPALPLRMRESAARVTPSCRASTMASGMANRDESACKKDEDSARDKLNQDWVQYSPAQKTQCVRLTTLGGPASYVELITCLEMKRDVAKAPADLGLQSRPSNLRSKP